MVAMSTVLLHWVAEESMKYVTCIKLCTILKTHKYIFYIMAFYICRLPQSLLETIGFVCYTEERYIRYLV